MKQREQALQQPHLLGVDGFTAGVGRVQSLALCHCSHLSQRKKKKNALRFFFNTNF